MLLCDVTEHGFVVCLAHASSVTSSFYVTARWATRWESFETTGSNTHWNIQVPCESQPHSTGIKVNTSYRLWNHFYRYPPSGFPYSLPISTLRPLRSIKMIRTLIAYVVNMNSYFRNSSVWPASHVISVATHCLVLCVTVEPLRNAYSEDSEMLRPVVL